MNTLYDRFVNGDTLNNTEVLDLEQQTRLAMENLFALGKTFKLAAVECMRKNDRLKEIIAARGIAHLKGAQGDI